MITVIVSGIVTGFLYAIAGLGLVAVYRTSRVLNFALGGMGAGAVYFGSEMLHRHLPYPVVIVLVLIVGALLGLLVELGVARPLRSRPPLTVAIGTLGALLIFQGVLEKRYGDSPSALQEALAGGGVRFGSFAISADQLLIIAVGLAATGLLLFLTYRTKLGLTMRASSSGPQTSELLGVDVTRVTRVAWVIGGAYGGLAALLVTPLTYLTPTSFSTFLLTAFAAVVLGGFTSIPGVVIGALLFGVGTNLLETYLNSNLILTYTFVGVALVLLLRPNGLFGKSEHEIPEPAVRTGGGGPNLDTGPGLAPSMSSSSTATRGSWRQRSVQVGTTPWARWGAVLIVLALLPFVLSGTNVFLMATALATFIGVLGLNIIVGFTGQVSLGQSGFLAIGTFTAAAATSHGIDPLLALPLAFVVGAVAGLIIGLPSARLSELYLVLLTLTFASAVPEALRQLPSLTGGANGLPLNFPAWLMLPSSEYWFILGIAAVLTLGTLVAVHNRLGRGWRAVRDSEDGAKALGMRPALIKLGAFALSSAMIALSGALGGMLVGFTSVNTYTVFLSIYLLLAVVLGGTGSIFGSLLGALFITIVPQFAGTSVPQDLLFGIALLVMLLIAPSGLVGLGERVTAKSRAVLASRRLSVPPTEVHGDEFEELSGVEIESGAGSVPQARVPSDGVASTAPVRGAVAAVPRGPQGDTAVPLLELRNVSAGYGLRDVLHDVSLEVRRGEVVALIGANGVGKSTVLRSISGVLPLSSGQILWRGDALGQRRASHGAARLGLGHVPEGRAIFPDLTVSENLRMGCFAAGPRETDPGPRRMARNDVLDLFPILRKRLDQRAGTMSGGEQQMLAIARALLGHPDLLMLDEPSLGLAPVIFKQVFSVLTEIAGSGISVLLVEQNAQSALAMADRAYVINRGRIELQGTGQELRSDARIHSTYLGLAAS